LFSKTRYYRAPEVILGMGYRGKSFDLNIDVAEDFADFFLFSQLRQRMWTFGVLAV
jgi:hypothetical protein